MTIAVEKSRKNIFIPNDNSSREAKLDKDMYLKCEGVQI